MVMQNKKNRKKPNNKKRKCPKNRFFAPLNDVVFHHLVTTNPAFFIMILYFILHDINLNNEPHPKIIDSKLTNKNPISKVLLPDFVVETFDGTKIVIEVQLKKISSIIKRICGYGVRAYDSQLEVGDKYEDLKKVRCILISGFQIYKDSTNLHYLRLADTDNNITIDDFIDVYVLETSKRCRGTDGDLDKLCSFLNIKSMKSLEAKKDEFSGSAPVSVVLQEVWKTLYEVNTMPELRQQIFDDQFAMKELERRLNAAKVESLHLVAKNLLAENV